MSTDPSPDRAAVWDRQMAVDAMLNKGGIGVWFCRDEEGPRAAVRGSPGPIQAVLVELAMVQIAYDLLLDGVAKAEGVDAAELRRMVELSIPIVREQVEGVTRLVPRGST